MISSLTLLLAFSLSAAQHAHAKTNDWSKGCFHGDCSYDVPSSDISVPASMRVWGSSNAVSDLTPAAGWQIMGCSPSAAQQDIRLVCMHGDMDAVGCSHVLQNGAKDTVVRLPDSCHDAAFAVVTSWRVADDQSIPADVRAQIHSQGSTAPVVYSATLDSDFSQGNANTHGAVRFSVVSSSTASPALSAPRRARGARTRSRRSLWSNPLGGLTSIIGVATSEAGEVATKVEGVATSVASDVASVATSVASEAASVATSVAAVATSVAGVATSAVGAGASAAASALGVAASAVAGNQIHVAEPLTNLPPVRVQQAFNLPTVSTNCGDLGTITFKAGVDVDSVANVTLNIVGEGTLVPPAITTFQVQSTIDADLGATLHLSADASSALFDTGRQNIFSVPIGPGLSIAGVLQVGPVFSIDTQASLSLSAEIDLSLGMSYKVRNMTFAFPPTSNTQAAGSPTPDDSPLDLSLSPNVTLEGKLTAQVIPSVQFGLVAFPKASGAFSGLKNTAKIFADVRASSTLDFSVGAGAQVNASVSHRRASVSTKTSAGLSACIDAQASVVAEVGADAGFFGLFDANTVLPVFSKQFELLPQKCFAVGNAPAAPSGSDGSDGSGDGNAGDDSDDSDSGNTGDDSDGSDTGSSDDGSNDGSDDTSDSTSDDGTDDGTDDAAGDSSADSSASDAATTRKRASGSVMARSVALQCPTHKASPAKKVFSSTVKPSAIKPKA